MSTLHAEPASSAPIPPPARNLEIEAMRALIGLPHPREVVLAHWDRLHFEERGDTLWGVFAGSWLVGRLGEADPIAAKQGDEFTRAVLMAVLADGGLAAKRMLQPVADRAHATRRGGAADEAIDTRAARRFLGHMFTLAAHDAVQFAMALPEGLFERCGGLSALLSLPIASAASPAERKAA